MKTVAKIILKLFAGCLVVLTVGMFGLGIYAFASPSSNPDDLTQKISSRVYQFLGKEYIIPETKYEKQKVAYTNISEDSDEIPTDDLFHSDEIPQMTSMEYLKTKSRETGTEMATDETYTSDNYFQYQFDKSGKLRRELYTDGGGDVWTYVYLYNSNDQLSAYVSRSYTGSTSLDKYEYDSSGRLILHTQDDFSSGKYKTAWQYNDVGQISQIDWSNSNGEYCTVFSYKNDNPVKETFYEDGEPTGWRINSYDSNGHRVKAVKYSPDGTVEDTWVLKYDASGNCTSRKRYTGNSSVADWEISYEYDSAGHQTLLKDRTVSDTREDTTVTKSEYDKNGNLIKKSQETTGNSCGGSSSVHTYTYDKNNNLIEDVNVYGADDSSTSQYEYQSIYDHMAENATSSSIFNNVFLNNFQDKFVGKWELYYVTSGQEFRMFDNSAYFEIYADGTAKEYINGYTSHFTYQVSESNPSELIFTDSDSGDPTIFSINDDGVLIGKMDEFDIEIAFIRLNEQQEEVNS